jgi:hypothetical protein
MLCAYTILCLRYTVLHCAVTLQLIINKRGWMSHHEVVLHEGEGIITAIAWRGALVAWANSHGVKMMDVEKVTVVTAITVIALIVTAVRIHSCCYNW